MDTNVIGSLHGHNEPNLLRGTHGQDKLLEPRNFWIRHRRLAIGGLLSSSALSVIFWALAHFSGAQRSVDLSQVTIATIERGSFVRDVAADGQVVAAVSPTVYAPSGGTVTLRALAGDPVEEGQVIAVIDSSDLLSKLSQEEALLENQKIDWQRARMEAARILARQNDAFRQAQVELRTARSEAERGRKAFQLGAYSELQVMKSEAALEKAQFAYDLAKANFESQPQQNSFDIDSKKALLDRQQYVVADLRRQIEALEIRSPVTGRVGQVHVADRANVARDAPLLTVVDLSALEVEIKVPESLARDLAPDMEADFEGAGRQWRGAIRTISPQVVNGEVAARLRFGDEKPEGLRQNQRLAARIFLDRKDDVLMVDRGPFLEQDGAFAYVVRDNVAERVPVRLGAASVQKVEVLEGLQEGDQIVVSGADLFYGDQRVILAR